MKEKTRIKKWFVGKTKQGERVEFKFTYSWDLNKQVVIKNTKHMTENIYTSLKVFQDSIIPDIRNGVYVLVSMS